MRRVAIGGAATLALAAALGLRQEAEAQRVDPRRPAVLVVGSPSGASPVQRVDARRTGVAKEPLPVGPLRTAWKKTTGFTFDQPALSGPAGGLVAVSVRGEVLFLAATGEERAVVKAGPAPVGVAGMTAGGTVVFTTAGGGVAGVHPTGVRFATPIGGERNVRAAPLALADGGVAVATTTDLAVLDADGNVRARAALSESAAAPLLAWNDEIVVVTSSGAVFGWKPGGEPVRLGSFDASVDGGVAIARGKLVAVIEGNHLAELDLARGGRTTRAIAAQGLYLGPPSLRLGASGSIATVLALSPSRAFVLSLDSTGKELLRAPVASFTPQVYPDGGAPALVVPPHTGTLVDARGAVAFAAPDGRVGVVVPEGAVETLGEVLCARGTRSGVVGLTPLGRGAFTATCDAGVIARIAAAADSANEARSDGGAPNGDVRPSPSEPSDSDE